MSYTAEQLLSLAIQYEEIAVDSLEITAKKKEKLDPKAKVRNRGTVCVPAENAKDKKDHFPINDEGQARSALSRVEGLTSAPWYNGSLEGLRALVKRKVHSKYPGIGKDKKSKKSYVEVSGTLFAKYAQSPQDVVSPPPPNLPPPPPPAPPTPKTTTTANNPQSADPWVSALQRFLMAKNFPLPKHKVDGKFGPETAGALKMWQQQYSVEDPFVQVTGKLDPSTVQALNPLIQPYMQGDPQIARELPQDLSGY